MLKFHRQFEKIDSVIKILIPVIASQGNKVSYNLQEKN